MSPELMRAKYPTQRPPTEVLANAPAIITLAFNHTRQAMAPGQMREAHAALDQQIKASILRARWNRSEVVRRGGQDVAVLDFWSPTVDGEVRNIMVVSSVEGRAMIVSFNVTRELEGEWGAVGERIMNAIRVVGAANPIQAGTTGDWHGQAGQPGWRAGAASGPRVHHRRGGWRSSTRIPNHTFRRDPHEAPV
jgi:hypothetical protein